MQHAEGSLAKLLFLLVGLAAVLGVVTVMQPYLVQYEVKQAAKLTCNTLTRGVVKIEDQGWREDFKSKAKIAGAAVREDTQFHFSLENQANLNRWHCRFKVAWRSETPIFLVGDLAPELPILKITHRIDDTHDVPLRY